MSGMFWASLAGARADSLQEWMDYATEQESRANKLERRVGQLQHSLGLWQEEAVEAHAFNDVHKAAYQEETGQKLRERIGDEEMDRRIAEARQVARKELLRR